MVTRHPELDRRGGAAAGEAVRRQHAVRARLRLEAAAAPANIFVSPVATILPHPCPPETVGAALGVSESAARSAHDNN